MFDHLRGRLSILILRYRRIARLYGVIGYVRTALRKLCDHVASFIGFLREIPFLAIYGSYRALSSRMVTDRRETGISAFMVLGRDERPVRGLIDTYIGSVDELAIVCESAGDACERSLFSEVKSWSPKIAIYAYKPSVIDVNDRRFLHMPESSPRNPVNLFNYALQKTTRTVVIRVDSNMGAFSERFARAANHIRTSGIDEFRFFHQINCRHDGTAGWTVDPENPIRLEAYAGAGFFPVDRMTRFVPLLGKVRIQHRLKVRHAGELFLRFAPEGLPRPQEDDEGLRRFIGSMAEKVDLDELVRRRWHASSPCDLTDAHPRSAEPAKRLRVAVLFIGTGHYINYFPRYYDSCRKMLLPESDKTFYVFTDQSSYPHIMEKKDLVIKPTERFPWPFAALFKYKFMMGIIDELGDMDQVVFIDADAYVYSRIDEGELLPHDMQLFGVQSPWTIGRQGPFETNPRSLASVRKGDDLSVYWQSCFWGGRSKAVIDLVKELSGRIDRDWSRNIIALWHDESHLNRYFIEHKKEVYTHHPGYAYPQDWKLPFDKRIIHLWKKDETALRRM